MTKIKLLAFITLTLLMITTVPVFAQETQSSDLPLLISPNPMAQNNTEETQTETEVTFTDIPDDAAYKEAVKKLVENGVLNGYPDGTFKPAGNLTRAEMCKMINLTLGYTDASGAAGFPDVTSDKWFYQYALAAQKVGYVKGYEDNTFRAKNPATRAEAAVICLNLFNER